MTDFVLLLAIHLRIGLSTAFFRRKDWVPAEMRGSGSWDDVALRVAFEKHGLGAWTGRVGEGADGGSAGGVEAFQEGVEACFVSIEA